MNKQPQTCYVPISTENELPKIGVKVICLNSDVWVTKGRVRDTESKYKWSVDNAIGIGLHNSTPTHWLKEQFVYLHTPEELAKAFRDVAEKAWYESKGSDLYLHEYLDQHHPLPQPIK